MFPSSSTTWWSQPAAALQPLPHIISSVYHYVTLIHLNPRRSRSTLSSSQYHCNYLQRLAWRHIPSSDLRTPHGVCFYTNNTIYLDLDTYVFIILSFILPEVIQQRLILNSVAESCIRNVLQMHSQLHILHQISHSMSWNINKGMLTNYVNRETHVVGPSHNIK